MSLGFRADAPRCSMFRMQDTLGLGFRMLGVYGCFAENVNFDVASKAATPRFPPDVPSQSHRPNVSFRWCAQRCQPSAPSHVELWTRVLAHHGMRPSAHHMRTFSGAVADRIRAGLTGHAVRTLHLLRQTRNNKHSYIFRIMPRLQTLKPGPKVLRPHNCTPATPNP